MSPKNRTFSADPYTSPLYTHTHQIAALVLVTATFFFTRLFDLSFPSSTCYTDLDRPSPSLNLHVAKTDSVGHLPRPKRGYESHLNLKIYVYDENEIDDLKELLHGRDGSTSTTTCLKGQWGSQVKIHRLLLESRFRTREKEEADLFFVPTYAKCVRITGGLSDKEINQTYVKGDRTDKKDVTAFNTWKYIILPANVDDGMSKTGASVFQPWPLSKRKYLANYLGRAQKKGWST